MWKSETLETASFWTLVAIPPKGACLRLGLASLFVGWALSGNAAAEHFSYRYGVDSGFGVYTGTSDTDINVGTPDVNAGSATICSVDGAPDDQHLLIRFAGIIGEGPGQIPPGSKILSAHLKMKTCGSFCDTDDNHSVHLMLQDWEESTITWNNGFGGNGIQPDDVEASSDRVGTTPPMPADSPFEVDVRSAVQRWSDGEPNHGLVFLPGGDNALGAWTSNQTTASLRPRLDVEVIRPDCTEVIVATSTFDGGAEGWTFDFPGGSWRSTGGNPGGYLRFDDVTGHWTAAVAPPDYLGDWTGLDGSGVLHFDHRILEHGPGCVIEKNKVFISGPGGSATWVGPHNVVDWGRFAAPIREENWSVTSGTWSELLTDVTELLVNIEAVNNSGGSCGTVEVSGLDNIVLSDFSCGGECVTVQAGEPFTSGGAWLLPIETPDPLDDPVFGYSIDYHVDPQVFEVTGFETAGSMIEFAAEFVEFNEIGPGHFRVAWADVAPLVGPGVLVYLTANRAGGASCGDSFPLEIGAVLLNEGVPCAQTTAGEFCVPANPISGNVAYYACDELQGDPPNPRAIPEVQVNIAIDCATSQDSDSTLTDGAGNYSFVACVECDNCLSPSKVKEPSSPFVSPMDASLVLKTVAETYAPDLCPMDPVVYDRTGSGDLVLCPPPPGFDAGIEITGPDPEDFLILPQRVAGDVSKNGMLSALDAALILQYAIGDSMGLASNAGAWEFYCSERCYIPGLATADADFVGILGGDVSGDWDPAGVPDPTPGAAGIALQLTKESSGKQLRFNVSLSGASGFLAARFKLAYDAGRWEYLGVRSTGATEDFLVVDRVERGVLWVAMAGAEAAPDGNVVQMLFERKGRMASREPRMVEAVINDGSRPVQIFDPGNSGVGDRSILTVGGQGIAAFPNPFRGTVNFSFRIERPGFVTLRIFGVDGRLVRTLLAEEVSSQGLSAQWDGANDHGRRVSAGTYFARLQQEDEIITRRLVMIR